MSPLHASPLLRVYSTLAAFLVIAACCATVVTAVTIPTMYYRDNPVPPRWVATPLPDLHFSWQIVWDATKTNANLVGTFNYTAGDMWVSVGLKSDYQMDGLCIICYISSTSGTSCTDWKGSGYGIDQTTTLTTVVSSYYSAGGVQQVVFSRPVYANGKDLGVAAWSSAERVIWGWGPMGGKGRSGSGSGKPGTHPGQGIASSLINFQTGEVVDPVNPNTHLVPVYVALGLTAALIIGIQATVKFRIPVHHRVRTATGVVAFLTYLGLWIWYIVASMDDYTSMGRLLPAASATGDAAAACLAVLLISGSRRFIAPDLLTVSHERMVVFHATTAIVMVGSMAAHAFLMIQMFCGFSFVVRWNSTDRYANLPGLLSGIVVVLIVIISLLRHRVSYRFFRYTHGLWVLIVIFAMLHVSRLAYFCIPGLALLLLNLLYGRLVNLGSRVEGVLYDHASRVVVLDISRPYWSLFNWSGCRATGLAPGQWFYICNMSLSWAWHPISVARAQVRGGRQHLRFMIRDTGNGRWTTALAHTLADVVSQPHQSTTTVNVDQVRADVPQMSVQPLPPPPKLSTWTWIEGPFGRQQLPLETYPRIVLVSGGIGVTPHLQTLQHLAEMSAQLKAEGRAVPWTSVLWLWTFREPSLLALVSDDLAAYSNMLHAAGVDVVMHHACSGKSHEALSVAHAPITIDHFGRIDVAAQLKQWHSSFTTSLPIGMFGCGPAAFTDTLFDASADVGVHVHIEVFEV